MKRIGAKSGDLPFSSRYGMMTTGIQLYDLTGPMGFHINKDVFRRNGESRKVSLKMSFKGALVFADQDIEDQWKMYFHRFLRGDWP